MWGLEPRATGAVAEMETVSCEGTIEEPEQYRGAVHCHPSRQHSKRLVTTTPEGMGNKSFRFGHKVRKVGKNHVVTLAGNISRHRL